MDIVALTRHDSQELVERLRQVPLLKQPEIRVYAGAHISLEHIHTDHLSPTQNYVWLAEFKKVQELRWSLAGHGVDLFRLDGFLILHGQGDGRPGGVLQCLSPGGGGVRGGGRQRRPPDQ